MDLGSKQSPQPSAPFQLQSKFKLVQTLELSTFQEGREPGLWSQHGTKFMQAEYIIDNIQICPNREGIKSILPARDGSAVCHVENGYNYREFILHVSAEGKALKILDIRGYNFSLVGMLTPSLALVVSRRQKQDQIVQWDLQTYEKTTVTCPPIFFKSKQCYYYYCGDKRIVLFKETGLLCCCWGATEKYQVQIAYFAYPLKSSEDKPLYVEWPSLPSDAQDFKLLKLNQHSKVGFVPIKGSQEQSIEIVVHSISQNMTSQTQVLKLPLSLVQFDKDEQVVISDLWQISSSVLFLQFSIFQSGQTKFQPLFKRHSSWFWNYKEGKFRKANFDMQGENQIQFLGQFRNPNKIGRSLLQEKDRICSVVYVDPITEQVLAIERLSLESRRNKIFVYPHYSPQLQYCFTNAGERWHRQQVAVRKVDWPKIEISLLVAFLLESIVEGCDEDLIDKTISLMECNPSPNT